MEEKKTKEAVNSEEFVDSLFDERVSIDLTPENAEFRQTENGLLSLKVTQPDGNVESFERVLLFCAFPILAPEEFLSVRIPDSDEKEGGKEIGMVRRLSDFSGKDAEALKEELSRRYFIPVIKKVLTAKEKRGYCFWKCETTAGTVSICISNPAWNVHRLQNGKYLVEDMEGCCFYIESEQSLDRASRKRIGFYL